MSAADGYDPRHPHEPEILPITDTEGRCLVCAALVAARDEGFNAGMASVEREPLWLLTGDLDWLEYAIADYVWRWGQHLPGVHPNHTAGTPVAVANMAMSVIRKNVRRIVPPSQYAACVCCGKDSTRRQQPDPWEGRLDGYCDECATARCDAEGSHFAALDPDGSAGVR